MSTSGASSDASVGRFQAGLLSLGSMHAHFGHVNQAMQVLCLSTLLISFNFVGLASYKRQGLRIQFEI